MPETVTNPNPEVNVVTTVSNDNTVNFETLIANARTEEKNKLYPQIETYKTENTKLVTRNNELLISVATKDEAFKAIEAENVTLKATIEELKAEGANNVNKDKAVEDLQLEIQKLKDQLVIKDGAIEQVRKDYELKDYRSTKLKDVDESVHELVSGNSQEEIDASIEKAKATYDKIASKFNPNPPAPPNPNPFNQLPPVNLNTVNDQFKQVTAQDIDNMSMADYAIYRKQTLGMK